jgi:hypothetical protein
VKYRKGACENCGAMTHKKKDCMERPRRVGAKYTGECLAGACVRTAYFWDVTLHHLRSVSDVLKEYIAFKMLGTNYPVTWCDIAEEQRPQPCHSENLETCAEASMFIVICVF